MQIGTASSENGDVKSITKSARCFRNIYANGNREREKGFTRARPTNSDSTRIHDREVGERSARARARGRTEDGKSVKIV